MSINQDTSLDMTTINDQVSATQSVKNPDSQDFSGLYDPKQIVFAPFSAPNEADIDISNIDDENNLSFSDIADKVKDYGHKALQFIGLENKPNELTKSLPQKSEIKEETKQKEQSLDEMLKPNNMPLNQRIKDLQAYFKSPDNNLKVILNGKTYLGPLDGNINPEFKAIATQLEASIQQLLNTQNAYGTVLKTNVSDVKEAVSNLVAYKNFLEANKTQKLSLDQRFIAFSKLIQHK